MNPIDADRFFAFLTEQKVKETGAFSKGLNKGLNIARSALKNKEITLPWEVDCVVHGRWIDGADSFGGKRGLYRVCGHCNICIPNTIVVPDAYWQYCPNCGAKMDGDQE